VNPTTQINPDEALSSIVFAAVTVVILTYLFVALSRWIRRRWIKVTLFNLLFVLNVLAATALLGEIWLAENWRENATGFRDDRNYKMRTPTGVKRAVIVGDSFTAGHGIAKIGDRFGNRIRTRLPEHEVHLFAKNNWDTGTQLNTLREAVGQGYQTDLVLLAYCLNDTSDANPNWANMMSRVFKNYQPKGLFAQSFFFNWLYWRATLAIDPEFRNYGALATASYEGPVWEEQQRRLLAMKSLVESNGGRFVLAILPFLNYPAARYPFEDVHRKLREFGAAHGIAIVDLQSLLTEADGQSLVVNRFDAHPNELAHQMIAEKLTPIIRQELAR